MYEMKSSLLMITYTRYTCMLTKNLSILLSLYTILLINYNHISFKTYIMYYQAGYIVGDTKYRNGPM